MCRVVWLVCATALRAGVAEAQTPSADPLGDWMASHKISIRKTFDGTKDEQNPASVFWLREPSSDDKSYSLIDLAAKVSEWEPRLGASTAQLLIYPVAEYHRSTSQSKRSNKSSLSAKTEFRPWGLTSRPVAGPQQPPTVKGFHKVAPTLVLDAKATRDFELDRTEQKYSALVFPTSNFRFWPGADWRDRRNVYRGRYYVYGGIEYQRMGAAVDTAGTFLAARIWAEAYPVASLQHRYVQLTGEWAPKKRVSGSLVADKYVADVAVAANVYLDGRGHLGVGVEYARGDDPTQAFKFRERTSVGVRIKF
jgi:hypothetical protein